MDKEIDRTIIVKSGTKQGLDRVKIIPEEPYDKVIQRLLAFFNDRQRQENLA